MKAFLDSLKRERDISIKPMLKELRHIIIIIITLFTLGFEE